MLGALEFGVFYVGGAEFAPVFRLWGVSVGWWVGVVCATYCGLPIFRHGGVVSEGVELWK